MKIVESFESNFAAEAFAPGLGASTMLAPALSVTLPARGPELDIDLASELAVAHAIQQSLLPKEFPRLPGFGFAAFCQSARHVGGDFYDILPLNEARALLVIADVMGKGVPAALFAASLRVLVRSFVGVQSRPAELLRKINRQMFNELSSVDMFITAQIAVIDTNDGLLQVAGAGHCPLLLADGVEPVRAIASDGLPLGIDPAAEFTEQTVRLQPDTCAFLYTDGLAEAHNPQGIPFGHEGLMAWLGQNAGLNQNAAQLKDQFLAEFRQFQAETLARDDMTLMVIAAEHLLRAQRAGAWIAQE